MLRSTSKKTCSPIHDPRVNQRACEGLVFTLERRPFERKAIVSE